MKKISVLLLLLDGQSINALPVARCLGQVPTIELHVLSNDPWNPLRFSFHRSSYRLLQKRSDDVLWLDTINQAIKKSNADILMPVGEPAILFVSNYSRILKRLTATTDTPLPDIFNIAVNKWLLVNLMEEYNIPHPSAILYTADEIFKQKLTKLVFPVLLKPTCQSGGRNIQYFDTPAALLDFLTENQGFSRQYIVQSFIYGRDLGCNVLCHNGEILAYTIQKSIIPGSRRFAPMEGMVFVKDEQVFDVISRLMSIMKWSGVANIDLRYDEQDKQVKVLEVNGRYWGSLLGSLVAGVNFPYLACLAALGFSFQRPNYQPKYFVKGSATIKQKVLRCFSKNKANFRFHETSLKYILSDPFPEIVIFVKLGLQFLKRAFSIFRSFRK